MQFGLQNLMFEKVSDIMVDILIQVQKNWLKFEN